MHFEIQVNREQYQFDNALTLLMVVAFVICRSMIEII